MIALAFAAGVFVGAFVGAVVLALCVAGKRGDQLLREVSMRARTLLEVRRAIPMTFWGRGSKWPDGTDPYYTGGQTALTCVHSILDRLEEMPDEERIARLVPDLDSRPIEVAQS